MEGRFEIVSLTGTAGPDGVHLHMAVSDEKGVTDDLQRAFHPARPVTEASPASGPCRPVYSTAGRPFSAAHFRTYSFMAPCR